MLSTTEYESNAIFRLYCGLCAERERNWALESFFGGVMGGGVSAWVANARVTAADSEDLARKIKKNQVSLVKTALVYNAISLAALFLMSYVAFGPIELEIVLAILASFFVGTVILSKNARSALRQANAALLAYRTQEVDPGPRDPDPAKELYEHCLSKNYFSSLEVQAIRLIRVNSQFFGH